MIVVNFATEQYYAGQERLMNSLGDYDQLMIRDELKGCPTHQESPYEFKVHAIERAFEIDDVVLWADASMWLVGDLSKIEKLITESGYYMENSGHTVGNWCNEFTRKYFNLQDYENLYPLFSAGLFGLNKKSIASMEFFYRWKTSAEMGCFKGDWKDHRHDMTAGSIIANRMKLRFQPDRSHMAHIGPGYPEPKEGIVFKCQGL